MAAHEAADPPQRSRAALLWAVAGSAGLLAVAGFLSDEGAGSGPRASGLLSRAAAGMTAQRSIRFQAGRPQALETWDAERQVSRHDGFLAVS